MSELEIKEQMAERLNTLLMLDPQNTATMIRSLFSFNFEVAKHQVHSLVLNPDTLISDTLGIINGLVGDSKYQIAPVLDDKGFVACFEVVEVDPTKVATVKQLEAIRFNEVDNGTQALEDKQ